MDDSSPDGTALLASASADLVITRRREGQTRALAEGIRAARYETVVTIDADVENDPGMIPTLIENFVDCDILVASRKRIPRLSEKLFSVTVGAWLGIPDVLSNFRVYRKRILPMIDPGMGETFGAEMLVRAKLHALKLKEIGVDAGTRRERPRIGGRFTANLRILAAYCRILLLIARCSG